MPNYGQMADEELIRRYREGDRDALDHIMEKYKDQVRKEANAMYLLGGENEDLIQEGMIGLFKAVQDYDGQQGASFFSFSPSSAHTSRAPPKPYTAHPSSSARLRKPDSALPWKNSITSGPAPSPLRRLANSYSSSE